MQTSKKWVKKLFQRGWILPSSIPRLLFKIPKQITNNEFSVIGYILNNQTQLAEGFSGCTKTNEEIAEETGPRVPNVRSVARAISSLKKKGFVKERAIKIGFNGDDRNRVLVATKKLFGKEAK